MRVANSGIAGEDVALRGIMAVPHRSSRTYSGRRTCGAEGCSTVLSVYNSSQLCWQHEPLHPFVLRIERKDKRRD
jgi:hypothetical protein